MNNFEIILIVFGSSASIIMILLFWFKWLKFDLCNRIKHAAKNDIDENVNFAGYFAFKLNCNRLFLVKESYKLAAEKNEIIPIDDFLITSYKSEKGLYYIFICTIFKKITKIIFFY
jgi:hypothetical protein